MNFNLKSTAFVLLAFFAMNTLSAQGGKQNFTAEQHAERQTERMTKELSLTDTQIKQVATLNLKYAKEKEIFKNAADENTDKKTAMKQMRDRQNAELKGILSAEQLEKYQTMRAKKNGRKKGAKGNKVSNHGPDNNKSPEQRAEMQTNRLTKELSLNDTQAARINAIHWDFEKKMQAAKEAEKGNKADLRTLRTERDAAVRAMLTPEQSAKFDAREKGRGGQRMRKS